MHGQLASRCGAASLGHDNPDAQPDAHTDNDRFGNPTGQLYGHGYLQRDGNADTDSHPDALTNVHVDADVETNGVAKCVSDSNSDADRIPDRDE